MFIFKVSDNNNKNQSKQSLDIEGEKLCNTRTKRRSERIQSKKTRSKKSVANQIYLTIRRAKLACLRDCFVVNSPSEVDLPCCR